MLEVKKDTYEKMWKELMLCLESETYFRTTYHQDEINKKLIEKIEMKFYLLEKKE